MGDNVGKAAIESGLPVTSIVPFVTDLLGQNTTGLASVPGVTPAIIGAGIDALLDTYTTGFRYVWVSALAFTVLATIGMYYIEHLCFLTNTL
jgi:hypothetical protein